jgi:hypothetical protein
VHPIERLRHVARAGDVDPTLLAQEAAEALGYLGYEAHPLVQACRRLIEAHPSCGPLWWVAARVIVADDPFEASYAAIEALSDDPTSEELAATFPSEASVVIPAKAGLAAAIRLRPDLSVTVVGTPYRLNEVLRRLGGVSDVVGVDQRDFEAEGDSSLPEGPHIVVLEALAAGPSGYLLDQDQAALLDQASLRDATCWVATGVGRILPEQLFAEVRHRSMIPDPFGDLMADLGDDEFELLGSSTKSQPQFRQRAVSFLEAGRAAAVVGPRGRAVPQLALRRAECRAPGELLGFARQQ